MSSANLLSLLIGVALPMLVALVTNKLASSQLKTVALLGLSLLGSALSTVSVTTFDLKNFVTNFAVTFGSAVIAHYGALRPLGVTGSSGLIATAIPGGVSDATADDAGTGLIDLMLGVFVFLLVLCGIVWTLRYLF